MECTLQVLLNIDPKAKENPAIRVQALAVQMYGKASANLIVVLCFSVKV